MSANLFNRIGNVMYGALEVYATHLQNVERWRKEDAEKWDRYVIAWWGIQQATPLEFEEYWRSLNLTLEEEARLRGKMIAERTIRFRKNERRPPMPILIHESLAAHSGLTLVLPQAANTPKPLQICAPTKDVSAAESSRERRHILTGDEHIHAGFDGWRAEGLIQREAKDRIKPLIKTLPEKRPKPQKTVKYPPEKLERVAKEFRHYRVEVLKLEIIPGRKADDARISIEAAAQIIRGIFGSVSLGDVKRIRKKAYEVPLDEYPKQKKNS
jgi:hypothetical protein